MIRHRLSSRPRAKHRLGILLCAFPALAGFANAGSGNHDADVLLQKVAAAYQQISDYQVEVETKVVTTPGNDPATTTRYVLTSSKPSLLFTDESVSAPISHHVRLGANGCSAWAYSSSRKQYALDDDCAGLARDLRQQHFRLFTRFEQLDRMTLTGSIEGHRNLSDGTHRVRCVVVRITPDPASDWTDELWVDETRYLVLKSVFVKRTLFETQVTTTTWRRPRVNLPIDPMIFRFVPPHDASRTNSVAIP